MTDRDKIIKVVSRAIERLNPTWKDATAEAKAALSALHAEGLAVVPVAMIERVIRIRELNYDEYGDACREYDSAADDLCNTLSCSASNSPKEESDE